MEKDKLTSIQYRVLGTKIGHSDAVSGEFFLRFVREYRAYDRHQKEILQELQATISELQAENECIKKDLERYIEIFNSIIVHCRSNDIVSRQRAQIVQLLDQNKRLKDKLKAIDNE